MGGLSGLPRKGLTLLTKTKNRLFDKPVFCFFLVCRKTVEIYKLFDTFYCILLFGMVTKYSEILLAIKVREKNEDGAFVSGPMYYIQNGLTSKWLAVFFAVFAMIACIGTGNSTQANSFFGVL